MTDAVNASSLPATAPIVGRHDVVITGGGLAGLTLALQLKQSFADLDVLVLERRVHPVPMPRTRSANRRSRSAPTTSSEVLGLKHHLETAQLKKFGFRFFSSEGRRDIDAVTEIGASRYLAVPSWQLDRGILENFLAEEATRRGVRFLCGATVRDIELAEDGGEHAVIYRHDGVEPRGARALARRRQRPRRPDQAASASSPRRTATMPMRSGSASPTASRSTTGPTTRRGARAARRRRAGSRRTTWWAPATGPG